MPPTRKKPSVESLFRAFADPTRLRILHLLAPGELSVCDLVDVLKVPQPKISRHLAYLRRSGMVMSRRQGLWIHYRLAPPRDSLHGKLLDCLTCCFRDLPELASDARKMRLRRPDLPSGSGTEGCCK